MDDLEVRGKKWLTAGGQGGGTGTLTATLCPLAADHLPVDADLNVPTAPVALTLRSNDAVRA